MDEREATMKQEPDDASNAHGSDDRVRISVRYWAGAAAAAGVDAEEVLVPAPSGRCSVGAVREAITDTHEGIAEVLGRCSLLLDGRRLDDDDALPDAAAVEVLPPFAGG